MLTSERVKIINHTLWLAEKAAGIILTEKQTNSAARVGWAYVYDEYLNALASRIGMCSALALIAAIKAGQLPQIVKGVQDDIDNPKDPRVFVTAQPEPLGSG